MLAGSITVDSSKDDLQSEGSYRVVYVISHEYFLIFMNFSFVNFAQALVVLIDYLRTYTSPSKFGTGLLPRLAFLPDFAKQNNN